MITLKHILVGFQESNKFIWHIGDYIVNHIRQVWMSPLLPLCYFCKHRLDKEPISRRTAFPKRIPIEILDNTFDHRFLHPHDGGISFEPVDEYRPQYEKHTKFNEIPPRNEKFLETLYVLDLNRRLLGGYPSITVDDDFLYVERAKLSAQIEKAIISAMVSFRKTTGRAPNNFEYGKIRFKEELRIRRQSMSLEDETNLFFYLAHQLIIRYQNSDEVENSTIELYLEIGEEKRLLQIFRAFGENFEKYLRDIMYPRMGLEYPSDLLD